MRTNKPTSARETKRKHGGKRTGPTQKAKRAPPKKGKLPITARATPGPLEVVGPEGFSLAALRAGALRLLMLAASFEHRPTDSKDLLTERQLRRVLDIIEPHVEGNADAEERARIGRLSTRIAAFYGRYRTDPSFDTDALGEAVKNVLEMEGFQATPDALDELVPADHEIRAEHGPQEAADLYLGRVFAVSPKSIENWRLAKVLVGTQVPFKVQVGPLNLVRHLLEMLLAASQGPDLELEKLKAVLVELIDSKHAVVAGPLSRLSAMRGRVVTKLEL